MVKVSKTEGTSPHLYINLLDFKDKEDQELWFKRIQELIKSHSGRVKVFG